MPSSMQSTTIPECRSALAVQLASVLLSSTRRTRMARQTISRGARPSEDELPPEVAAQVHLRLLAVAHLAAQADEELAAFGHLDLRAQVHDQFALAHIRRARAVELDAEGVALLGFLLHEDAVLPAARGFGGQHRGHC